MFFHAKCEKIVLKADKKIFQEEGDGVFEASGSGAG